MAFTPGRQAITEALPHRIADRSIRGNFEHLLRLVGATAAGGEFLVDGWFLGTSAASQTAAKLKRWDPTNGPEIYPIFHDWYVSSVGLYTLSTTTYPSPPAGGSAYVEVYKSGTGLGTLLPQVSTTVGWDVKKNTNKNLLTLAPGDNIGVRYTSDGSWTPTNTQLLAVVGLTPR